MSSPQISTTNPIAKLENDRSSVGFHPNIWGDLFLSIASNTVENKDERTHGNLKEKVRRMIILATNNPLENLDLIDAIHRLGVFYHFEKEIDEFMHEIPIHHFDVHVNNDDHDDLHFTSLLFRLLRQHGHKISSDVFNKFKDAEGNFKETLASDVRGMLSLYEATQLRVHGEDILEQGLDFATTRLASMASSLSPSVALQIKHALKQCIQRNMPRYEARHFISVYEQNQSHDEDLMTFAKMDFNILQKIHQKELSELQRWYKSLVAPKNLSFARDRVVECYLFALAAYFEPEYTLARIMVTKFIVLTSIVDDIYDSYGKYEELELFTQAIERWDISHANYHQLPDYMKRCYEIMLDIFEETEKLIVAQGKSHGVPYAINDMKALAGAYLKEATWFNQKYVPKVEEYIENGIVSSPFIWLSTISFLGMGDVATKQVFEWTANVPKIIKGSCLIARLINDITSSEFEQERGHVATSVECYMKQFGIGRAEAVNEIRKQIENQWKDINEDCLNPTSVPNEILMRPLNYARVCDVVYNEHDGYTFPEKGLKDVITSLLVDPVPL